jgi:phage portal protein BeeE
MLMFNWFKNFRKKDSAVNRALTLFLPLDQTVSSPTDYASLAREGFSKNSMVFACVKDLSKRFIPATRKRPENCTRFDPTG